MAASSCSSARLVAELEASVAAGCSTPHDRTGRGAVVGESGVLTAGATLVAAVLTRRSVLA
jgi:hypothetical protein